MIVAKASPTRRFVLQCLAGAIGFAAFGDNAQAQRKAHPNPLIRKFVGHTDLISSVAFSPDGRTALSGSFDNTLKLWDVATGATIQSFAGHSDFVTSVAFQSDGRTALSGRKDATVRLWEVANGKELRILKGPAGPIYRIAISSDGRTILSGAETGLTLWDMATGRELRTIAGAGPVAALSSDGRTVLAGGWRACRWQPAAQIMGHGDGQGIAHLYRPHGPRTCDRFRCRWPHGSVGRLQPI